MEINEIEILSVGVDVGSSTSHLAFSKLVLKKEPDSVCGKARGRTKIIQKPTAQNNSSNTPALRARDLA